MAEQSTTVDGEGSVVRRAPDIVARRLGDAAVLVRLTTNRIYELNETGARIWDLLEGGSARDRIVQQLEHEFDASTTSLASGVDELLATLRAEGLVIGAHEA